MNGNCECGCKHCVTKEIYKRVEYTDDKGEVWGVMNEFVGYKHTCPKNQKAYDEWHERNKDNTYEQYKHDYLPCYEPTEVAESLNKMIEISENILDRLNKKENG